MHWQAHTDDVRDLDGYALAVSEDTPSWVLSHACEMIVETLNERRNAGKDWPG